MLGTTLLVLPLAPFTDDAVLLYNVVRLLTFLLPALTAYWLARELGVPEWIALLAGALFAFSPIRTDQVAHLSTLGTQWWPLELLFTIRFARGNKTRDALLAALFFVLAFLACGYHGVIAGAVLPPCLLVVFWGRWDRLKAGLVAAVLAGLALLPVYRMHQKGLSQENYSRGTEETILYSAGVESFLSTSAWNKVYGEITDRFRTLGPNNLFPGLVVPGLVLAGVIAVRRSRERPSREAVALGLLLVTAALVALGPRVRAVQEDMRLISTRAADGPWIRKEPPWSLPVAGAPPWQLLWRQVRDLREVPHFLLWRRQPTGLWLRQDAIEDHQPLDRSSQRDWPAVAVIGFADGAIPALAVEVIEPRAVVLRVRGRGEPMLHECPEEVVGLLPADDAPVGAVLAPETDARVQHDEHEEARLAGREAKRRQRVAPQSWDTWA